MGVWVSAEPEGGACGRRCRGKWPPDVLSFLFSTRYIANMDTAIKRNIGGAAETGLGILSAVAKPAVSGNVKDLIKSRVAE